jgi:hypothetical protein
MTGTGDIQDPLLSAELSFDRRGTLILLAHRLAEIDSCSSAASQRYTGVPIT